MPIMKYLTNVLAISVLALPTINGDAVRLHHFHATEWDVVSPLTDPCVTERGFFGRNAKFERSVTYQYELTLVDGPYLEDALIPQTGPEGAKENGLQGVFTAIETGIADALLESEVFDDVCAGGEVIGPFRRNGERQLRGGEERQLRAVGISSNPEDQILEGITCRAFVNETDGPCIVVDGEFKIYMDIFEDLDGSLGNILSDLMNENHKLDDAHPYIQKVRYIDLSADLISGYEEDETVKGNQGGPTNTLSSSVYALIAAGTFVMVGTAIFYRRRRNAADHDGETATLDQTRTT